MRERLIELFRKISFKCEGPCAKLNLDSLRATIADCNECRYGQIADYLLANGVIFPPCKAGDDVYVPNKNTRSVDEYQVIAVHNYGGLWEFSATRTDDKITYTFDESIVGDNVFLTKEEAEQALKGGAE